MSTQRNSKLKVLYLRQILENETDGEHGLTMPQLIERLECYGIQAERKSVYRDLEMLRESGFDVCMLPRRPVEYAAVRQGFSLSELMLLADAVGSSKSLTQKQADALITHLKLLASDYEREKLDRRIHVAGRVKAHNESVFAFIDTIHEAMRERRKVSFTYYRLSVDGKRIARRDGRPHIVTPVAVSYDDGFYYLTAWNDTHEDMAEFRIDRMDEVLVSDEHATRNNRINEFVFDEGAMYFGHFNGESVRVTLRVENDHIEIILDRFGDRARLEIADEQTIYAHVNVRVSPQFFGWVAGLNGAVSIAAPARLVQEYKAYLSKLIES